MDKPITLCDRCDIVMSCLLDYDGVLCRRNRTVQPTNADRIRAMTDEELAKLFANHIDCGTCPYYNEAENLCESPVYKRGDCTAPMLEWLKREADK
jgi:hypothetical protein